MEDHIQKHKREQAARISNSYNIPTLIEKAESSNTLEKGGIGSGRKRGDYVVHKNPITGRLHEGRLHSEDKDGKYHHIRTTTGDLEYVESKHTTDASPQKADQIHRIMNERKFADGKSYNDEFKKAEDSDFEARGREHIERYLSPGEIEKARISQNLQECYSIDSLEKGKKADIGEIRTWGGVRYVKHQDGWVAFNNKTGKGTVYGSDGKKKMNASLNHIGHYVEHTNTGGGGHVVLPDGSIKVNKPKDTGSLENKTAKELRSYLMGSEFPNDAKIRIQEKIGYADTTVKELRDRLYSLQDQNTPTGIKSIELIGVKKDPDQVIHEDSKKIADAAGISEEEFKKLHPDTKKELLSITYSEGKEKESKKDKALKYWQELANLDKQSLISRLGTKIHSIDKNTPKNDIIAELVENKFGRGWSREEEKKSPFKSSEGSFTNDEDERLSYRVYDDGAVKITGANVRKDFNTKEEATIYVRKVGFNDPDHIKEGISKKE